MLFLFLFCNPYFVWKLIYPFFLNENLELVSIVNQTENNNPITPKEDKAKVYNIPKLKSDKTSPWPKGITAH